jgi:hypothetical protein
MSGDRAFYEPKIGDVVYNQDGDLPLVIIGLRNFEDAGSLSYSRDYVVIALDDMVEKVAKDGFVKLDDGFVIKVRASKLPFSQVVGEAPFELTQEIRYLVRRKVPRTVTLYE